MSLEFVDFGKIKSIKQIPVPEDDKIHLGYKQFTKTIQIISKINKENKKLGNTPDVNCQQMIISFSCNKEQAYSEIKNFFLRTRMKIKESDDS